MNLLDENFQTKEEKNHQAVKAVILGAIVLVCVIICAIVGYLTYIKNNTWHSYIDGREEKSLLELLKFEGDDIYIPIIEIGNYIGYEGFKGEYQSTIPNEINKCYVRSENEVVNFELGLNKIYKLDRTKRTDNYEYINIEKPVKSFDGVLYAEVKTFEKAFNVTFNYNSKEKTVEIYTLPYLVQWYSNKILDLGYAKLNDKFANQKAILNNMLVVEKSDGTFAVIDTEGKIILEPKYQNIEYLPNMGNGITLGTDFVVTSNNKVGVMSKDGNTKIQLMFDSVEILDIDKELYLVQKEGKYGVQDIRGQTIIHPEVDAIGYDISKFSDNGIKNKYILAGNLIPAMKDGKWGLYDPKGNLVVDFEYDSLGYVTSSSNKNALNLLVIPDYNVIVACKERKYILLSPAGDKLFGGAIADDIYMEIEQGKKSYYINANDQIIDAEKYLERIGLRKGMLSINLDKQSDEGEEQEQMQQIQTDKEQKDNNENKNQGNNDRENDNREDNNQENESQEDENEESEE